MGVEGEAGGIFEKQVVETRQKHNRSEEGRAPRIFFFRPRPDFSGPKLGVKNSGERREAPEPTVSVFNSCNSLFV
jgi:hypothetical protein